MTFSTSYDSSLTCEAPSTKMLQYQGGGSYHAVGGLFICLTKNSYMQLHAPTAVAVAPLSPAGAPTASALTRFSTSPKRLHHLSSRTASSPIWFCPSTRGCTHEIDAVPATWSSVPRISFRLDTSRRQRTSSGEKEGRTHLRAFMRRCSTSSTGRRVSVAIVAKESVRSYASRRKTDSMSAMRQIFWRKNG
jgi:hypothetical protein